MRLASVGENDVIAHLLSRKGDKYIRSLSSYLKNISTERVRTSKNPRRQSFHEIFIMFDTFDEGVLNLEMFEAALREMGHTPSHAEASRLARFLSSDSPPTENVSYASFMEWCAVGLQGAQKRRHMAGSSLVGRAANIIFRSSGAFRFKAAKMAFREAAKWAIRIHAVQDFRGYSYGESDGNEGKRGESETKQEKVGAKKEKQEKKEKKKKKKKKKRRKRKTVDKSTISGSFLQNLNTKRRGGKPPRYKDRLIPFPTLSALNDHLSLPKESREEIHRRWEPREDSIVERALRWFHEAGQSELLGALLVEERRVLSLRKDRLKSLRKIVRSGKLPEITEKRSDDPNYYDDRVMPDGYGEKIFRNGDIYKGGFKNNRPHGDGTMLFRVSHGTAESTYTGNWSRGRPEGYGTREYRNGDRHDGLYKRGLRDGQGCTIYKAGGMFKGEWKHDKHHGEGFREYHDGRTFAGNFGNGKPLHGTFTIPLKDGTVRTVVGCYDDEGRWVESNRTLLEKRGRAKVHARKIAKARHSLLGRSAQWLRRHVLRKKEPHRLYKIDASRLMEDADYMRMKRMREAEERRHRITTKLV
eukprot:g487.t1